MTSTAKIRVIPRLDIKGPNLVKGIQFDGYRVLGRAEDFARIYYKEGADELIYYDAVASLYQRNSLLDIISKLAKEIFIPLTVAGGIRSIEDIRQILIAGADKVAINTAAVQNPKLLYEASRTFGSQCIVSSIEAYRKENGCYGVWTDYGREISSLDAFEWAQRVEELGVGEILVTCINQEGTGRGFDSELTHNIASKVSIPVIASGGAGMTDDFLKIFSSTSASAISAASIFHYYYADKMPKRIEEYESKNLRMGAHVDIGNIDFFHQGYGGRRAVPVKPASILDVKKAMSKSGLLVRSN